MHTLRITLGLVLASCSAMAASPLPQPPGTHKETATWEMTTHPRGRFTVGVAPCSLTVSDGQTVLRLVQQRFDYTRGIVTTTDPLISDRLVRVDLGSKIGLGFIKHGDA